MVIRFQIDKQPEKVEMYHKELLKQETIVDKKIAKHLRRSDKEDKEQAVKAFVVFRSMEGKERALRAFRVTKCRKCLSRLCCSDAQNKRM